MQLNISDIRHKLGDEYYIEHHEELPSTNDRALELVHNGQTGLTLVTTDFQSMGRGRRGAVWSAPAETSILCSLILHPTSPLPNHHLAILTGVGVANGIKAFNAEAKIKWPNDIMVNDRKVAGILVETANDAVVVGFGINCNIPQESFPEDIQHRAGSLHSLLGKPISREDLLASVVKSLVDAITRVEAGGIIKVLYEWNSLNWLSRRKVRVTGPMGVVEGDGLFLDGRQLIFHVFKDYGVVPMPLVSTVEAR